MEKEFIQSMDEITRLARAIRRITLLAMSLAVTAGGWWLVLGHH